MEPGGELELLNASCAGTLFPNASVTDDNSDDTTSVENILKIKPIIDILLLGGVVLVMLVMGFEIKKEQLIYHIRRPIGVSIGMLSQFVVLPLSAFSLLQCISVKEIHASGVLLMACCPGGAFSNIITYFCDGDLSLSVGMTSLSTLIAMGMMPLNLWMYGRNYETESIVVPYARLALSLFFITFPVVVGMLIRWKFPRIAAICAKVGSAVAVLLLTVYIVFEAILFPNMFSSIPGSLYGVILSLPVIGFSLGYTVAFLLRRNSQICKTIAIECSIQNVPMALGIITISFPMEIQKNIVPLPYLYSFAMISCGALFCCIYRVYRKCTSRRTAPEDHGMKEINCETEKMECEESIEDEPMPQLKSKDDDGQCEFSDDQVSTRWIKQVKDGY